jgi:hypothetical protein
MNTLKDFYKCKTCNEEKKIDDFYYYRLTKCKKCLLEEQSKYIEKIKGTDPEQITKYKEAKKIQNQKVYQKRKTKMQELMKSHHSRCQDQNAGELLTL